MHLQLGMLNILYSPQIQNELIDIVAFDVLQKDLIEEIKQAKFFSVLLMK